MILLSLTNCGSQKDSGSSEGKSSDATAALTCSVAKPDEPTVTDGDPIDKGSDQSPSTPKPPANEDDYYDLNQEVRKVPGNELKLNYKESSSSLCEIMALESTDYLIVHLVPEDCEDCLSKTIDSQKLFVTDKNVKQLLVKMDSQALEKPAGYPELAADSEAIFSKFFKLENDYRILVMNKYSEGFLTIPENAKVDFDSFLAE